MRDCLGRALFAHGVPGDCTRCFPSTAPVRIELRCVNLVSHREQRNVHQRSVRWSPAEGDGGAPPPLLPPVSCSAIPGAQRSYPQNSATCIVINEHFESASLLILSCWLSVAIVAEPHHIGGTQRCSRLGECWVESTCVPDAPGLIVHYQSGDVVKRHRELGSVVESCGMAPAPRAPKPQFPRDAAVAEGFIFWQKCFHLHRDGGSVNSFWCALITSLPASCRSRVKNSQISSPACLWAALTHVGSCEEKRRG